MKINFIQKNWNYYRHASVVWQAKISCIKSSLICEKINKKFYISISSILKQHIYHSTSTLSTNSVPPSACTHVCEYLDWMLNFQFGNFAKHHMHHCLGNGSNLNEVYLWRVKEGREVW